MNARKVINELYRAQRLLPFAWGENDCLTWCAACTLAITGRDPIALLRGRYSTAHAAIETMATEGWDDLGDLARSLYAEIPVAQARTGDWARIVNPDGSDTLGVVAGAVIVARSKVAGLMQVPLLAAAQAFRVAP